MVLGGLSPTRVGPRKPGKLRPRVLVPKIGPTRQRRAGSRPTLESLGWAGERPGPAPRTCPELMSHAQLAVEVRIVGAALILGGCRRSGIRRRRPAPHRGIRLGFPTGRRLPGGCRRRQCLRRRLIRRSAIDLNPFQPAVLENTALPPRENNAPPWSRPGRSAASRTNHPRPCTPRAELPHRRLRRVCRQPSLSERRHHKQTQPAAAEMTDLPRHMHDRNPAHACHRDRSSGDWRGQHRTRRLRLNVGRARPLSVHCG